MIVITNDDGIEAPGIAALWEAVEGRKIIVAPREAMSECSHRVTTKCPIRVERVGEDRWAVDGTPADCTRVAILHLAEQLREKVELVLSGINQGGNLGADVYISGTVAAAREAAFFGVPAVALSQVRRTKKDVDWRRNAGWWRKVLDHLRKRVGAGPEFWNVNFPEPEDAAREPALMDAPRSLLPLPVKYTLEAGGLQYVYGRYNLRTFEKGSDIDVCFGGDISVSVIGL